ncbi:MAG: serine protease [Minisyncoccia bacterium]
MLKSLFSIIIAYIVGFGGVDTKVYEAPLNNSNVTPIVTSSPTALPTPSVSPTIIPVKNSTVATTTKTTVTKKISTTPTPTPSPTKQPEKTIEFVLPQTDFEKVNSAVRIAIINIICTTRGGELSPISGTGVVISKKGIIVTNAHIGQYFLLKDFREKDFIQCVVRTGSPAYPTFNVELMYISPTWISENKEMIGREKPLGTGENDFAFLRITGRVDGTNLPTEGFPYLTPSIREMLLKNEPVILISYPAGFLGGLSILQNLNITSSITNIKDIYTFREGTIDILDVAGTIISQKGSSGGAVIDSFVSLLGIITTSSEAQTTDKRELRAITLSHINRTIQKELGFGLDVFLSQDPEKFSALFASTTAPGLRQILENQINN